MVWPLLKLKISIFKAFQDIFLITIMLILVKSLFTLSPASLHLNVDVHGSSHLQVFDMKHYLIQLSNQ